MTDITWLHDKQVKLLQTYFLNKQPSSPLHAAVVNSGDSLTPLDLHHEHEKELSRMKNTITKLKDNGPKKPYMASTRTT
jgi:hypothetical protein